MIRKLENTTTLRVAEAAPKDAGRAIARLDPEHIKALGITVGDTVAITGKRTTVCKVMPTYPDDRGQSKIHIDGLTRNNLGAGIDDQISVAPAPCEPATNLVLKPVGVVPTKRDLPYIGSLLDGIPVLKGDTIRATLFGNRTADFLVERTNPSSGPVLINPTTTLDINAPKSASKSGTSAPSRINYEDVGGLKPQLQRIRETIELPLRFPELFERLGIDPPKGVLLHGPPGCGKTLIARAIAHETEASFFTISGPEIVHKNYGQSEAQLRKVWDEANKSSPAIIFIDEIDSIAPKREDTQGDVEKRIVAQLLTLMDGLDKKAGVMVIAATNLPNNIDSALRRPGRFDREIEIPIPDAEGRGEILTVHSRGMPLLDEGDDAVDLTRLANITHGCVGADLEALCREAALHCLRSIIDDIDFARADIPYDKLQSLNVSMSDFQAAFAEITPSAMREVFIDTPNVRWSDVGGLDRVKKELRQAIEWPLTHAPVFKQAGIKPPKGIVLAGPPGVGKTLLAKATATEAEANFISVKGPELLSRFVGDSEKGLREVFRKARQASPCVIFFDEVDAILPARGSGSSDSGVTDRVLAQFLAEMDGVEELNGVLVLAATNRLDMLDPAVLRPGRFDRIIEIEHPTEDDRTAIFSVHLDGKPIAPDVTAPDLGAKAAGASGAQVAAICQTAALAAAERIIEAGADPTTLIIELEDFHRAIEATLDVPIV